MKITRIVFSALLASALISPLCAQPGPPPGEPGPRPPAGMRPAPHGPLPGEVEEEVLSFLRNHDPERAQGLEQAKKSNPEEYRRALAEAAEPVKFMLMLQEKDPDGFQSVLQEHQLESSSRELARAYREGKGDKEALKIQLREVLNKLLEVREQNLKHRLEKQLAEMKEMEGKRASMVDHLCSDLLADPDKRR